MTDLPPATLRYRSGIADEWVIRVWPRQLAEMWKSAYGAIDNLEVLPHYLRVLDPSTGNSLGVLRREDITGRTAQDFEVSSDCALSPRPRDGAQVLMRAANDAEYDAWRSKMAAPKKHRFWAAVVLTVVAGGFQLAFDIGKIYPIIHVGAAGGIAWTIGKYVLLSVGVYGIQQYSAYKNL